jgi:uncharacterized protein (DUF302 family)
MDEQMAELGLRVRLTRPYQEAVALAKEALGAEGFGVLTEIDVKATLKKKLGVDFYDYVILGACNPPLAHQALTAEPDIGLLLPCNVVVYEHDGGSMVLILDPLSMLDVVHNPALEPVAKQAGARLKRVAAALQAA